jgi:hypothetical protein
MGRMSNLSGITEDKMSVKLLEETGNTKRLDKRITRIEEGKEVLNTIKDVKALHNSAIMIEIRGEDEVGDET